MSTNLRNCVKYLEFASKIPNKKLRQKVFANLCEHEKMFCAVREIAANIVHKNIKLDRKHKRQLRRYGTGLRKLSMLKKNPRSATSKRKIINQTGGSLPILIPLIIDILATLATQ